MSKVVSWIARSALLVLLGVVLCCGVYPLLVWCIGQVAFPFQANGSLLKDRSGRVVGSELLAQPFTGDEYFWPRPSAASYDATSSAASTLAASNYLLRDRVARALGPTVRYRNGSPVGPDIVRWFLEDRYRGRPGIVAQWTAMHPGLATAAPSKLGPEDIEAMFFNMWLDDHPDADLEQVPADAVMASGSGLDPHITVENAEHQLPRVAAKWAEATHRSVAVVQNEIEGILRDRAFFPLGGLTGVDERLVNVLEINLALHSRFGLSSTRRRTSSVRAAGSHPP